MGTKEGQLGIQAEIGQMVISICDRLDRRWNDGEDTAAEVFVFVSETFARKQKSIESLANWVSTVARRHCNQLHKRYAALRSQEQPYDEEMLRFDGRCADDFQGDRVHCAHRQRFGIETDGMDLETASGRLRALLAELSDDDRALVEARKRIPGAMRVRELATLRGCTVQNLYQKADRKIRWLRERLK
jgi:DNA-directed RNA polymerase specialized sigma24 family protein